jgi:hypothetical protein
MEEQLAKCRFNASMVCLFHFKGAPASVPWVISDEVVKIDVGQCCGPSIGLPLQHFQRLRFSL